LLEARTPSLTGKGGPDAMPVQNPLSADDAYLRRDLLSGLVRAAERNWAVREREVRLFEIGVTFRDVGQPIPEETLRVAVVLTGARSPRHWSDTGKADDLDLWDLKALFEDVASAAAWEFTLEPVDSGWDLRDTDGRVRGGARILDADRPAWAGDLFGFELDLELRDHAAQAFRALPTTPPVERDLALVLPPGVHAAQVDEVIRAKGGPLLAEHGIFDEYRGKELAGRSVAWRLVFRAPDRTLKESEADKAVRAVLLALKEQLGVERREA
jgi:phenylalanyl-tRNA synthetase beta chain